MCLFHFFGRSLLGEQRRIERLIVRSFSALYVYLSQSVASAYTRYIVFFMMRKIYLYILNYYFQLCCDLYLSFSVSLCFSRYILTTHDEIACEQLHVLHVKHLLWMFGYYKLAAIFICPFIIDRTFFVIELFDRSDMANAFLNHIKQP